MIDALPSAKQLLGDKGYDADWFRQALAVPAITASIPSKFNRKKPIEHDRILSRQRHKIENMFGRLKDWRRIEWLAAKVCCRSSEISFTGGRGRKMTGQRKGAAEAKGDAQQLK